MNTPLALNGSQLAVVRQTIAKDCDNAEFDLFLESAKAYGLDPFRRQIAPLIFSKNDKKKRSMSIVVTRDGLRVMASRCGDYRPASEPAQFVIDTDHKSPTNPKGIVSVSVKLWKQDNRGEWYPVIGEADWDEFAPITYPYNAYRYEDTGETYPDSGKPIKRKVLKEGAVAELDKSGQWAKMPKVMIQKCAEAQALRAGWPETFSGVYVEEEMDRTKVMDAAASEIVEQEMQERRLAMTAGVNSVMLSWLPGMPLEAVSVGAVPDRVIEWIEDPSRTLEQVQDFTEINRVSLQEFWAKAPGDALEVKKRLEARTAQLARQEQAA